MLNFFSSKKFIWILLVISWIGFTMRMVQTEGALYATTISQAGSVCELRGGMATVDFKTAPKPFYKSVKYGVCYDGTKIFPNPVEETQMEELAAYIQAQKS